MSVGKKSSNKTDTSNAEIADQLIESEASPVCPALSKSTMNLINYRPWTDKNEYMKNE